MYRGSGRLEPVATRVIGLCTWPVRKKPDSNVASKRAKSRAHKRAPLFTGLAP
jgi:hypothetical protein